MTILVYESSPKFFYNKKNPFLSVQSVSSAFQKRQPINFHQNPFVPFVIIFFKFLKFFKSVFQKSPKHSCNSKKIRFYPSNLFRPHFKRDNPSTSTQHPFVPFVIKKIRFYPFNPFHPRSKRDCQSTFTNTLLCFLW